MRAPPALADAAIAAGSTQTQTQAQTQAPTPTASAPTDFDAILQVLDAAIAAPALCPSEAPPGGGPESSIVNSEEPGDEEADEDTDDSAGASGAAAFLAQLISLTPRPVNGVGEPVPRVGAEDAGGPSPDDAAPEDAAPTTTPAVSPGSAARAAVDGLVTLALSSTAAVVIPVATENIGSSDNATADGARQRAAADATQGLMRAAEMLGHGARPLESERTVLTHARDPRWSLDFTQRVSLLVRGGESTATLALTPVDLGPVEVQVSVKDSQATIQFAASQADTRALIESSLPRLRELLASQGFNLLDASVSSGFSRSSHSGSARGDRPGSEADAAAPREPEAAPTVRRLGLLDLYA